jgi:hypothetical protein
MAMMMSPHAGPPVLGHCHPWPGQTGNASVRPVCVKNKTGPPIGRRDRPYPIDRIRL